MRLAPTAGHAALALLLGTSLLCAEASRADDALDILPPKPSGALRVYLVRHGEALSNLDPAPNLPPAELDHLTPLGRRQAAAAGRALAGRGVVSVLTSPAFRARETADGVARALRLPPPAVEPRLRPLELGRGSDGRPLTWKDRSAGWEAGRDSSPADGESMARVGERVDELVRELARGRATGVVLVAHGEVLAAYLGLVRGIAGGEALPAGPRERLDHRDRRLPRRHRDDPAPEPRARPALSTRGATPRARPAPARCAGPGRATGSRRRRRGRRPATG